MATKRLVAALAAVMLLLAAAVVFGGPLAPEGSASCEVVGQANTLAAVPGVGLFIVTDQLCADGAQRTLVNGRLFVYDPNPNEVCAAYYADVAMLGADGHELPEAQWDAPDWQRKVGPDCLQKDALHR